MSYLKNELTRLVKYAEGLGIKVLFLNKKKNDPSAEWTMDGSEIRLYKYKNDTLTNQILSAIHELGHHLSWVNRGRKDDINVHRAIDAMDRAGDKPISKSKRKVIYEMEKFDSQYHEIIYNELGLKIPKYKMLAERDLSNWGYKVYYLTGKDPTQTEFKIKRKELRLKYKEKE